MALDDRDRSFEKALARRLRANASAAACPDAETLAAYHEGALTPEELNSWKQHIAACVSCKEVIAQLEATDEIPVSAAVVSMPQNSKLQRAAHWRWLTPVGALAAGLLVWVAVHERQPAKVMQPAKIEVAENRAPASPPVPTNATVDRENSEKFASSSKATTATGNRTAAVGELKNRRSELSAKVAPAPPEGNLEKADRKDADLNATAQTPRVSTESGGVGGVTDASKSKHIDELGKEGQAMNYLAQLPAAPKPSGGAPGPMPQMDKKSMPASKAASAAPPPAVAETLALSAGSRDAAAIRMTKSRFPRSVPAPGGKVIWRLGMAGLIEQSTDKGLTWTAQTSGTTADLLLGSAPSENVCWVIGGGDTILRTEDGGAHWLPVASPISQNLALIRASDALHATVWDSSRRHGFQTSDGGTTWTQVSSQ